MSELILVLMLLVAVAALVLQTSEVRKLRDENAALRDVNATLQRAAGLRTRTNLRDVAAPPDGTFVFGVPYTRTTGASGGQH
jgi:predicted Holliday junction resolvase-like endonuclease